ncbi:unnamed protein product, partial [Ectocarpus sp. 6 AP-2014]
MIPDNYAESDSNFFFFVWSGRSLGCIRPVMTVIAARSSAVLRWRQVTSCTRFGRGTFIPRRDYCGSCDCVSVVLFLGRRKGPRVSGVRARRVHLTSAVDRVVPARTVVSCFPSRLHSSSGIRPIHRKVNVRYHAPWTDFQTKAPISQKAETFAGAPRR